MSEINPNEITEMGYEDEIFREYASKNSIFYGTSGKNFEEDFKSDTESTTTMYRAGINTCHAKSHCNIRYPRNKIYPTLIRPWCRPDPMRALKQQDRAAFKAHLLENMAALEIQSPTSIMLSKIICTIGPSNCEYDIISKMIEKGMTCIRVDFATGSQHDNINLLRKCKQFVNNYSAKSRLIFPITIIADFKGNSILTGKLAGENKIELKTGGCITLSASPAFDVIGTKDKIFIDCCILPGVVNCNDIILLNCGRIKLKVRGTVDFDIVCDIEAGGELRSYSDVAVPEILLNIPYFTNKTVREIAAVVAEGVDVIFIPEVTARENVDVYRHCLGVDVLIFAKIENKAGVKRFEEIIEAANGVVVDRCKLSIEMSTEKIMQAIKVMVAKANKVGKSIICAGEFMNSMISKNCPTIAEVADVISIIKDGFDGIQLNDETAMGSFPIRTVQITSILAKEAESLFWQQGIWSKFNNTLAVPFSPARSMAHAIIETSLKAHATAILIVSVSGSSSRFLSQLKPRCPIFSVTRYGKVARQLNLWKGIIPVHFISAVHSEWDKDVDIRLTYAISQGKRLGYIKPGDPLILASGWRQDAGSVNNMRLFYASENESIII